MKRSVHPDLQRLGYVRRQGRGSLVALIASRPNELTVISAGQAAGWSLPSGELAWEIHAPAEAGAARNGTVLLGSRALQLWRDGQLVHTLEGHRGRVSQVALSPDCQLAASLAEDSLRVWGLEPPALLRELPASGSQLRVDWEKKQARIGRGRVERWDIGAGLRLGVEDEEDPAEASLSEGSAWGSEDGMLGWRDERWEGHEDAIVALAEGPDWLASASADRVVRVWSGPDDLLVELEAYQDWLTCQALSPDGRLLGLGTEAGAVRLVEAMTGKPRKEWHEHSDTILCLGFSPSGEWLASGSEDGLVGLVQVRKGELRLLDEHDAGPSCLAFSPDSRLLATGSAADEIIVWDVKSGLALERLLGLEAGLEQLVFSPQGMLAGLYDDGSVILWETSRYG